MTISKKELESIDFDQLLDKSVQTDPNINYNLLHNTLKILLDKHFPLKTVRFNKYKNKRNNWITQGLMKSIKFRDKLYKLSKNVSSQHELFLVHKNNLRVYNKILKNLIRDAKLKYYDNEFNKYKNDIKKTWNTIYSVIKNTDSSEKFPSFVHKNDQIISKQEDIVEEMNSYFINIGHKIAPRSNEKYDEFSNFFSTASDHTFKFKQVTENCVRKAFNELKSKETKDVDGLSTKLLKQLSGKLYKPIALIINQSLGTGIFPDKLKIAKVHPIHKGNDLDLNTLNNYRPISILPCISKIFERIIYNQLYEYFNSHDLLYESQYGFRLDHSTEFAAIELTNSIHDHLSNGFNPIVVYMDLSKAFDTLNHDILVNKLKHYGVNNTELNWFISYLSNRFQYVNYNNKCSALKKLQQEFHKVPF